MPHNAGRDPNVLKANMKKANEEHTFRWVNLAVGSGGQLAIRVPGFRSRAFALCPPLKPDCVCALRRNTGTVAPSLPSSPFSAVRFVLGIIAKYGHLSRIAEGEEQTFSAVQTAWRRGRDSNPLYMC